VRDATVQAHAAAADEESRRKRTAERSKRLAEVQKQQAALEQAQASALQVGREAGDVTHMYADCSCKGIVVLCPSHCIIHLYAAVTADLNCC
jgi:phage terminase Nu1 subunit (DNA packaging protein)